MVRLVLVYQHESSVAELKYGFSSYAAEKKLTLKSRRTILASLVPYYITIERPERRSAKGFQDGQMPLEGRVKDE